MTHSRFKVTTTLAALVAALLLGAAPLRAQSGEDRGFVPDSGQINQGSAHPVPSINVAREVPTQEEARAALMMPDSGDPSPGGNSPDQNNTTTTGTASAENGYRGPIASTVQTMPAKFSHRNDVLDRVPIMAWPLRLDAQQRQQIYQAVMADKTKPAADAAKLKAAGSVTAEQANDVHPLPASLKSIPELRGLSYVKDKNRVLLVRPDTSIVVDEIGAS